MNWRHETWRKLYIREEGSFAALSYSARAAAAMLLKLCDDRGRIYSRGREDVVEAVCFRLAATRGERRMLRQAIADLVADGYLAIGEGWIKVRNFYSAQGRPDELDVTVTAPGSEAVSNVHRTSIEPDSNASRPSIEPDSTVSRPSIEECVNSTESITSGEPVPSVPFLPSVPEETPSRDPAPRAPVGVRVQPDSPSNLIHVLGVLVREAHPEVGLWAPGRFAEKDAVRFYDQIPNAERARAVPTIRTRLEIYVREASDDGWTLKGFLDRFNGLGQHRNRGSPRLLTVGAVRAEGVSHPIGEQEI